METAAKKIMKNKSFIKAEMDRQLTRKQSDFLWRKSTKRLDSILIRYQNLPKGVHTHTDSFIFPAAAIYLTAKEYVPAEKGYSIIENAAIRNTAAMGEKLAKDSGVSPPLSCSSALLVGSIWASGSSEIIFSCIWHPEKCLSFLSPLFFAAVQVPALLFLH